MTIGFIGAGNMASAIIKGAIVGGVLQGNQALAYDLDGDKLAALNASHGVAAAGGIAELVGGSDMLVLAVKPQHLGALLAEHKALFDGKAVISIAAGWSVAMLRAALPQGARVLRVMPNTPALVGEGMSALSLTTGFTDAEKQAAHALFCALGRAVWVDEGHMEAVIGVSGSGPAYAYLFIEALADAGVHMGLPRQQSTEMAAQTLLGAAKMALMSGEHPGALKDMVCSPGGTTIAAVRSLEQHGFRAAVIDAAIASHDRAVEMQK